MALVITPEVFFELMSICLLWEWEQAEDRYVASLGVRENPLYPTQTGYTTVDKIVRILFGLNIVSGKLRSLIYKDRRLQHLVLRRVETITPYGGDIGTVLKTTKKDMVLRCDIADEINREKMLRNMHFFITDVGRSKARSLAVKYSDVITREKYFAEIKRQEDSKPKSAAGLATVMGRYRQRVATETDNK